LIFHLEDFVLSVKITTMTTETLPIYRKGSIRYAIPADGKPRPIVSKRHTSPTYRNSTKTLPDGLRSGKYLGNVFAGDATELDFVGTALFTTEKGMTRLSSEITPA
jgi:hypothetical protein